MIVCPECGSNDYHPTPHLDGMTEKYLCLRCKYVYDKPEGRDDVVESEGQRESNEP
jgi:rubredoxin